MSKPGNKTSFQMPGRCSCKSCYSPSGSRCRLSMVRWETSLGRFYIRSHCLDLSCQSSLIALVDIAAAVRLTGAAGAAGFPAHRLVVINKLIRPNATSLCVEKLRRLRGVIPARTAVANDTTLLHFITLALRKAAFPPLIA